MLYAVTIEPFNAIFFVCDRPEQDEWEFEEGVELEIPFNYESGRTGNEPAELVLCRFLSNPRHYRMFKNIKDVDLTEFEPTGKHFGGLYSRSTWSRFMKNLPAALAVHNVPDSEPAGATDEAIALIKQRG